MGSNQEFVKLEDVRCPWCGSPQQLNEELLERVVTCWAEDGPQDLSCQACDKDYVVNEHVVRDYNVSRKEDVT